MGIRSSNWRHSVATFYLLSVCASEAWAGDAGAITPFTEEAVARGLLYDVQPWPPVTQQYQGFGIAIADLNGSGHQDVIVLGNASGRVGLFENLGNGQFDDRSWVKPGQAKLTTTRGAGIAVADYNGDGRLDVYITQQYYWPNILLRNEGDFNFTNVADTAGVDNLGHSEGAAWGDYDNDGWLDLYVCNYTFSTDLHNSVRRNKLYRNLGNETFADVSLAQGVDCHGASFTAAFSDFNRNGWLDLYVANDRGHLPPSYRTNQSWINKAGTFENTCETSGLCLALWSMCVAAGDITGDGYVDFYVTNLPGEDGYNGWNPLFVNQGDETFVEACVDAAVCQQIASWAGIFFDFDNNSWQDLYVCNQAQENALFANDGAFPLTDVTMQAAAVGSPGLSFNAAVGDVTGDGGLEILVNDYGSSGIPRNVHLYVNNEGPKRNWARLNVVGHAPNRFAIGSNVELTAGGQTQWRELYAGGNNFRSQNELVYHFGLDDAAFIDTMVVRWPGGDPVRTLISYPANATWTIYPPDMLGDGNADGVVNVSDLIEMLSAWGGIQPGAELYDMNGDGAVSVADLLLLLSDWG